MNDAQINQAIDHAVHQLLDVEPAADLRARVIVRVDRPAASAFVWTMRMASLVAVAAILVIGVLLLASQRARPAGMMTARVTGPVVVSPTDQPARPRPAAHAAVRVNTPGIDRMRSRRRSTARLAVAANDQTPEVIGIAPLEPIAPIRVAAVTHSDIEPEPITVAPLAPIANLRIAPLPPSDARH